LLIVPQAKVIGSLFSGIGGLELGLERALGWHVAWQVEQNEWCRRVLAKHWPNAQRFDDVRTVGAASLVRVGLICGGFPCQDVSGAGLGAGIAEGTRSGLWIEFDRIIGEISPEWVVVENVVVENVASGAGRWLSRVRHDLRARGYGTRAFAISAADVGAPHLRRRIFVVGHADGIVDARAPVADSDSDRRRRLAALGLSGAGHEHDAHGRHAWPPRRGDGTGWAEWAGPQPGIRRGPDGISRRMDRARLKALGNAVVPQCAEAIGRVIAEMGTATATA